jgi:DNA-binding winged helix-turn-helix (wHTH) protein
MAVGHVYQFGPFRLDPEAGILYRGDEPTMLGQRTVVLLRLLLENAGAPVSKDALVEAAWGGLAVADNNLTVQIAALRRALASAASAEGWIETLPRHGYRYVGLQAPWPRHCPTGRRSRSFRSRT